MNVILVFMGPTYYASMGSGDLQGTYLADSIDASDVLDFLAARVKRPSDLNENVEALMVRADGTYESVEYELCHGDALPDQRWPRPPVCYVERDDDGPDLPRFIWLAAVN